jgi:hypothetical protein
LQKWGLVDPVYPSDIPEGLKIVAGCFVDFCLSFSVTGLAVTVGME